jgi:D-arabinonate dehydratase
MRIERVEGVPISIPLEKPAVYGTNAVSERNYALVFVHTDTGLTGCAHTLSYDGPELVADAVDEVLAPMLDGEDPRDTARLWRRMFDGTVTIGRKGVLLRAISLVDTALWDIKAKDAEQPLFRYLGAYESSVPVYASGGYYHDSLEDLRAEVQRYVDRGHDAVKMKVGRLSAAEDAERVRAVRETIGDDRRLLLDANGAYSHEQEAVRACRRFGEFDPYFVEEPVMPDSVDLMARVNRAIDYPVAAGELEFSRYGFADLITRDAVGIVQADTTVVGGVTEWLRVANTAASFDVPVAPHWNHNLHAHLNATIENGLWVEYFYPETGIRVLDTVVEDPLEPTDGALTPPERPGHGVTYDDDAVAKFRIDDRERAGEK